MSDRMAVEAAEGVGREFGGAEGGIERGRVQGGERELGQELLLGMM